MSSVRVVKNNGRQQPCQEEDFYISLAVCPEKRLFFPGCGGALKKEIKKAPGGEPGA
jgi:hypothetical protein